MTCGRASGGNWSRMAVGCTETTVHSQISKGQHGERTASEGRYNRNVEISEMFVFQ